MLRGIWVWCGVGLGEVHSELRWGGILETNEIIVIITVKGISPTLLEWS